MNASEINSALKSEIENLCKYYLPNGHKAGNYYYAGSVNGAKGDSLVVYLSGTMRGFWKENSPKGGETFTEGSPLDLIMACKGISDVGQGLKIAHEFLGIKAQVPIIKSSDTIRYEKDKTKLEKVIPKRYSPIHADSDQYAYLTIERGIKPEVLRQYRVGMCTASMKGFGTNGAEYGFTDVVAFPLLDPSVDENSPTEKRNPLVGVKYRAIKDWQENGKMCKSVRSESGSLVYLFGCKAIPPSCHTIVITEGEIDALSYASVGIPAVSISHGAGNLDWITNCFEWLERFSIIKISFDMDKAGRDGASQVIARLGNERCEEILLPEGIKDANEALLKDPNILLKAFENSKSCDPQSILHVADLNDKIWNEFFPENGESPGYDTPFKINFFKRRPGEVTLWTAFNKHGKTILLSFLQMDAMARYGLASLWASMEIKPEKTVKNAMRQFLGKAKPGSVLYPGQGAREEYEKCLEFFNKKLFIYNCLGTAKHEDIIRAIRYAVRKYDVKQVIVDSFLKMDCSEEDNDSQKIVAEKFVALAMELNIIIDIVAHLKKPSDKEKETNVPTEFKYKIRGSSTITDLVHNVCGVWRNLKKAALIAKAQQNCDEEEERKADMLYDTLLRVEAQRETGEIGSRMLYFDKESWQFSDEPNFKPTNYLDLIKDERQRNSI